MISFSSAYLQILVPITPICFLLYIITLLLNSLFLSCVNLPIFCFNFQSGESFDQLSSFYDHHCLLEIFLVDLLEVVVFTNLTVMSVLFVHVFPKNLSAAFGKLAQI